MISPEDQARVLSSTALFTFLRYRHSLEAFKDGWLKGRGGPKMRLPVWLSSDYVACRTLTFASM